MGGPCSDFSLFCMGRNSKGNKRHLHLLGLISLSQCRMSKFFHFSKASALLPSSGVRMCLRGFWMEGSELLKWVGIGNFRNGNISPVQRGWARDYRAVVFGLTGLKVKLLWVDNQYKTIDKKGWVFYASGGRSWWFWERSELVRDGEEETKVSSCNVISSTGIVGCEVVEL
jgi:hypothetical protein